jgi:hypothetical protein
MSKGNDVIERLTEGDGPPQEIERHDVVLRPAKNSDPPNLIREVARNIKERIPEVVEAGLDYVEAKGKQAKARTNEIQVKAFSEIGHLENEAQRVINQRDAERREAANKAQRDQNTHHEELQKLKLQALNNVVDNIVKFRNAGITVDLTVINEVERTMKRRLRGK